MKLESKICNHCKYTYTDYKWHEYRAKGFCSRKCFEKKPYAEYVYIRGQKYDKRFTNINLGYSTRFIGDIYD